MSFEPESKRIVGAALSVHRVVGPGLLESVYQRCLAIELRALGAHVETEVAVPLQFRGISIGSAYRADLVVDGSVLVEVKSVQRLEPVHTAQVLTYLKLTGLHVGLLLNFNTSSMRDGIVRIVL
jgi:GxxExxY protein